MTFHAPEGPAWLFFGVALAIVVGPIVAARLRLPPLIGLLAGGLVIGPNVAGIVPATDTTVSALGQLGLLYLMFSAGVELDLGLFRRYQQAAGTFGLMTFAAPMAAGFLSGRLLDYSASAALLLGSLWASHTLVAYPMVRQAGLSGNRAVATTVGATVITDTMSLVVLAGVAGTVTGSSGLVGVMASIGVGLVGLAVYAGWLLPRLTRWSFTVFALDGISRFVFLLAALLSAAVVSEVAGIEGIVGAFFAGLGLNRLVPAGSALMERIEFFGSALLVPLFLVSVGLIIEPSVIVQPSTLGLAAVFCAAVFAGKGLAALAARPVLKFTAGESLLMFGMTVPQAAATLAATFVGFDIGLFGEQVVNAVLVVILVTLLVSSLVTARALRSVEPTVVEGQVELGRRLLLLPSREDRLDALAAVSRALVVPEAGIVLPLRVTGPTASRDAAPPFLDVVEGVLAKAGLEARTRLRVATDPVEAVEATVLEDAATIVLTDWQASSRHQASLAGGRDDDLLDAASVPVVLAALSDEPISRVVLAFDRADLVADSAGDAALAVEVATRVAGRDCDRLLVAPDDPAVADLAGGFAAPSMSVVPGSRGAPGLEPGRAAVLADVIQPGDVVVMPANPMWAEFGPSAVRISARPGVSVLVVADPQRWTGRYGPVGRSMGVLPGPQRRSPIATASRWG